jgi:hypothetical protein
MMLRRWPVITTLVVATALLSYACATPPPAPDLPRLSDLPAERSISYEQDVRPILETRCAVCHACYDAPCQLLTTEYSGLTRGATKQPVYDSSRLRPASPTRLGLDATAVEQWREKGFFSILDDREVEGADSLLLNMLALGRAHTFAPGEPLADEISLDINRKLSCPANTTEFDDYAARQPMGGMPYGTASLSDEELMVLTTWVNRGAPGPESMSPIPQSAAEQVEQWEGLLNGASLKERITARYLWEHWVFAHLYFEDHPEGPFFEISRSTTPPGQPVVPIPSRRPYDDPGVEQFWYRLTPIVGTIVHKTHITYPLNDARKQWITERFLESEWSPSRFPPYGSKASNPFTTFEELPARARYEFLLADARYYVMTFIRGPVCRGQVAVDVIRDHFFVGFVDPDHDLSVNDPAFLAKTKNMLELPARSDLEVLGMWTMLTAKQRHYLDTRAEVYDQLDPERIGPSLDWMWDGDGHNPNAMLTVFRHFDNANVSYGWVGQIPKTAWLIDYPILERIYYDLVADFDVYGNLNHQVSTRLYMDQLRMQAEMLFLEFLPADERKSIRDSWYVGATGKLAFKVDHVRTLEHGTQVDFRTSDPMRELIELQLDRSAAVSGPPDLLNRCDGKEECDRPGATTVQTRADAALRPLSELRGGFIALMPELSLLRVRAGDGKPDAVYTLVHNSAHTNVASMFKEQSRRIPQDDTLTTIPGYIGSYPNFAFEVPISEIEAFVSRLSAIDSRDGITALADDFGIRRSDADFWQKFDWFQADFRRTNPQQAGLLDLSRYQNL